MTTAAWKRWPRPAGIDFRDFHLGCAGCGAQTKPLVLDHCHESGLVRGFLCRSCNALEWRSDAPMWIAWRAGDHPAAALAHAEEYVDPRTGFPPPRRSTA